MTDKADFVLIADDAPPLTPPTAAASCFRSTPVPPAGCATFFSGMADYAVRGWKLMRPE